MEPVDSPFDPLMHLDLARSCGEGGLGPAPHALEVSVYAESTGPRQGTLTVFSASGETLAQTAFDSSITVSVHAAETDLRLVLEMEAGLYLAARVAGYRSGTAVVLSPLSTLVDAYAGAHPGMDLAQAQARVLESLALPPDVPVGTPGCSLDRDLFDNERFYRAAGDAGGMAALAGQVAGAVNEGRVQGFGQGTAGLLGAGKSTEAIVKDLVDGLAGNFKDWAGGQVKGWLMQVSGLNSFLRELGLGEGEDSTAKQLQALTAEIQRLSDAIDKVPRSTAYIVCLTALETLKAFVKTKTELLQDAAGDAPPSAEQLQEQFVKNVNESLVLTQLHDNQVGSGSDAKGLIRLLLDDHPKFYAGRADTAYDEILFNAFNQARVLQVQALNLKIEAAHADNPPQLAAAERCLDDYHIQIKRQRLMYPNGLKPFADGAILDRATGLMWKPGMFEYDGYEALLADPASAGNPWRLPTIEELRSLMPPDAARARLLSDDRSAAAPAIMRHFGFLPLTVQKDGATQYRHFADLGPAGSRDRKILGPGYIVTSNAYKRRDRNWGMHDYELRTLVMNLYNGDEENIRIKFCRGNGQCYTQYGSNVPPVPWTMPVLYVRRPPVPIQFKVEFYEGFKSTSDTAQGRALALYSDSDRWKDVTEDAIWSVVGDNASDVHVSNSDGTSGLVQLRSKERTPRAYTIKAELPWYLSDQPGQSGRLDGTAVLYGNQSAPAPVLKRLLLSPAKKVTKQYPSVYDLHIRGVLSSGAAVDQDEAAWSWTSNDPSVQISSSGRVTVSKAPASKKQIQIKAKSGDAEGFAYLVLLP
ncbi:DUF1566 domain-containing protein [Paracidovorax anthurii]|uniref:Uncharacterized protein n=1 Tax=Paracidovorax anthurii TaxID=78229 RepID=A0A328YRB3_9BURK|nr:DUF1566 domain-containing protein [Paracidovorax anthurii]RAR76528.1 hypothetical protein AX018_10464 [Paracidovorax anthurii]